ncbi:MAG: beta-propeller fold lactonase family protein, partial [Planctomycetes bacterium]|nr:beta-propeller fold lactonase family protein [Planctomycetota bacterium]
LEGSPDSRPIGLALSRDNRYFYVSNQGNGTLASYELDTLRRLDADGVSSNGTNNLMLGRVPSEALLSSDGQFLLTLDYGSVESPGDSFYIVRVDDNSPGVIGIESSIGVGMRPTRIATSPDGTRWYVTNNLSNTVSVISAESPFQVLAQIPTDIGPNGVAISPDGRRGFVCNFTAGTVTVFDTASNESIGTIAVGAGPARALVAPNGEYALVSCFGDNMVHFIDIANNTNVGHVSVLPEPSAMAFGRGGSQVYLTSRRNDVVTRFDFFVNEEGVPNLVESALIATARTPAGLAVTNDGSRLIVVNEGAGFPQVIYLEEPAQTIEAITRGGSGLVGVSVLEGEGSETSIADRGEVIVLRGQNYSQNPEDNIVTFNGARAEVLSVAGDLRSITVRVPDEATSGPLVIRIGERESTPVNFIISPRIPRVLRTSPSSGAIGLMPNVQISITFNEPVIAGAADVRLMRMLDTFTNGVRDLDPTPIGGTVVLKDFGRILEFTPNAALTETAASNNLYRFEIFRTVTDLIG